MKPIIGIIYKNSLSNSSHKINYVYEDLSSSVKKSGGIPIGISNKEVLSLMDICNGFIFQGGDEIDISDILSLKEIINLNKPILCICLGMQELATLYQGTLYSIPNHHHKGYHKIIIKENTLLYKILKQKEILVNSRHHDAVKQTNLLVSSISQDNIIESIEVPNKTFALGLQWHPESIYTTNIYSRKIFSYFINACKSNK